MHHDVLHVVVGKERQHEIHPRANSRGSNPPWHRQLHNGVPCEDSEYTNDGANGRVPEQDTPSEQPAGIRQKEWQENKTYKSEGKADALAN